MRILRSRMVDHARKVGRRVATVSLEERPREETGPDDFERLWDCEWSKRLVALSLERLKRRVGPKQFQIFHAYMVLEWSMAEVTNTLGVSQRQVYMAKYRVGEKFQEELRAVQAEDANETQE